MEYEEFSGKTVEDAITEACTKFTVPSSELDYEILDKGAAGFLGINSKPALIRARIKAKEDYESQVEESVPEKAVEEKEIKEEKISEVSESVTPSKEADSSVSEPTGEALSEEELRNITVKFLSDVFKAMDMEVSIEMKLTSQDGPCVEVNLDGPEMGLLIGKRGQTLDSLQYLLSLVLNKNKGEYIRVKLDTENYRQRRKDTLENLAKNLSYKVKRTRRSVSLEPMNPYERRIIHSALQNDRYVTTHSEGEEPFRRVVITLKK